jgi:hypothetical protein
VITGTNAQSQQRSRSRRGERTEKRKVWGQAWWLTAIIPAAPKAKIRRITVSNLLRQNKLARSYLNQ